MVIIVQKNSVQFVHQQLNGTVTHRQPVKRLKATGVIHTALQAHVLRVRLNSLGAVQHRNPAPKAGHSGAEHTVLAHARLAVMSQLGTVTLSTIVLELVEIGVEITAPTRLAHSALKIVTGRVMTKQSVLVLVETGVSQAGKVEKGGAPIIPAQTRYCMQYVVTMFVNLTLAKAA